MRLHNIKVNIKVFFSMAFVMFLWTGNASANAIDALNIGVSEDVICNGTDAGACSGFFGSIGDPVALSLTRATNYPKQGNPTAELGFLNDLLDDVGLPNVSFVDKTDTAGNGFTTNRQYFSIKKGLDIWYFANNTSGALNVDWLPEAYSHYTEYGAAKVVPLPAAVWLFGSALIGVVGFARRSAKTA